MPVPPSFSNVEASDAQEEAREHPAPVPAAPTPYAPSAPATVVEPPPVVEEASSRPLGPAARVLAVALLIGAGALAGLLLTRGDEPGTPQDALTVVRSALDDLTTEFETDEPTLASRFVSDAYGRRVSPPELRGYALTGVAAAALDADATTPAFVYGGPGGPVGVVALDYALLDAAGDRLALGPDLRGLLSGDDRAYLRETEGGTAVLWRDRDDVFVAFPPDAQAVADAVVLPTR